jgi:hypothetical protein
MVRGRRQNPDAPPSRQLEISRAFRKRKANDLQILRDRADKLERENFDLRKENERLRILFKRPSSSYNTLVQYNTSNNDRSMNRISENNFNGFHHAAHDRTNSMPTNTSRRGEELIQNIQDHWSFQTGFDQLSHSSSSSYDYPIPTTSTSDGNIRNSAVSQPSEPSMQSPQSSTTQSFQVVDLRPETQMQMLDNLQSVHTDNDESEQQITRQEHQQQDQHRGSSAFNQNSYTTSDQQNQLPLHATDQESAQRLWELAVRANGGDTDKCCVGLFECDDQGRIKVETPPHIAYPA